MPEPEKADESTDNGTSTWAEPEIDVEDDSSISEYEITASPNDFNIKTIFDFIESGTVKIPGFQRNYVWDLRRASKLIESILIGIPIPQLFLYEEARNRFLVIDGQQRLMSIYYFKRQRFPRKEKRAELRRIFDQHARIPDEIFADDRYFEKFNLRLAEQLPNHPNRFNRLNYATLGDYQTTFDLRTIRNIIVKQNVPPDDDSCIYEIFNRLNSGGVNLTPQEFRISLYHSTFFDMLYRLNVDPRWRTLLGIESPDLHMKDVEVLLRGFAILIAGDTYKPSMLKFLNQFSKDQRNAPDEKLIFLEQLFHSFLEAGNSLPPNAFFSRAKKFGISMFEAIFAAVCETPYRSRRPEVPPIDPERIERLRQDADFTRATQTNTADTTSVQLRLTKAREYLVAS